MITLPFPYTSFLLSILKRKTSPIVDEVLLSILVVTSAAAKG